MVLEIIYQGLNVILNPLINLDPNPQNPMFAIFVISTLVAFVTTMANKLLVNQDRLQALKKEMQEFQQEMNEARKAGDTQALEKIQRKQSDFMNKQKEMMTMSFKPMIVTFLPIILVFYWMSQDPSISQTLVTLPQIAYYVLLVPIWHSIYVPAATTPPLTIGWLGWYILCSFAMSQIFRKFLGLKGGM